MYVAAYFVSNRKNKYLPIEWVDGLNLSELSNEAINSSLVYTVFYSLNLWTKANFDLPTRDVFEGDDGCYKVHLLRFFDSEDEAKNYCEEKRVVHPVSYTEKKQTAVHHLQVFDEIQIEGNVEGEEFESKRMLRIEIQQRIDAMNGLVFDVTDSDLEDIQEVIETNSDDDDDHDEANTFVKEADFSLLRPIPGGSLIQPIHKPDSEMNADNLREPVDGCITALDTNPDQELTHDVDSTVDADSRLSVQNEHNHEIQSILRQLTDHVPDKYIVTFDEKSNRFHVSGINKYVKGAILKIVIDWNSQPVFDGIIYDAKFVELLLVGVIGKKQLIDESYNKKDLRFIQDIFVQRVKNQTSRAIRFGGYVHNKIKREQRKGQKQVDY